MGSTYIFFLTLIRNYNIPNCPRIFPCDRSTNFKLNDFLSSLRLAKTTLQTQIPLRLDAEKRLEMDGAAPSRSAPRPSLLAGFSAVHGCVRRERSGRPAPGEATCRLTAPRGSGDQKLQRLWKRFTEGPTCTHTSRELLLGGNKWYWRLWELQGGFARIQKSK